MLTFICKFYFQFLLRNEAWEGDAPVPVGTPNGDASWGHPWNMTGKANKTRKGIEAGEEIGAEEEVGVGGEIIPKLLQFIYTHNKNFNK